MGEISYFSCWENPFKVDREILVNFNEPKFKCKISEKFFEEIEAKFNKDQYKKYAQWIKFQTLINNKLKTKNMSINKWQEQNV